MVVNRTSPRVAVAVGAHPAGTRAILLGVFSALTLCGLIPLAIVGFTPSPVYDAWPGGVVIIIVAGLRFSWVVASGERHLFEMTTWLFVYVFLGISLTVQLRRGVDPNTTPNIYHQYDWQGIAIILIGCAALLLGSSIAGRARQLEARFDTVHSISPARASALGYFGLLLGALYISQIGLPTLFGSRDGLTMMRAMRFPDSTTNAVVTGVVTMTLLVSAVAQVLLWRSRASTGTPRPKFLLGSTLLVLFTCVNFSSSPRYVFGSVALGVLAAVGIYRTRRAFRAVALGAIVGLLFVFPLLDIFRKSTSTSFTFENPLDSLLSGDFDSAAQINNTAVYVDRFGIVWGDQLLGVLFFWVPRSIWPNKAVDTGVLVANSRDYGFTNISAPLWSEFYINGGWVGLTVGMFLLGFAVRRWDRRTEVSLAGNQTLSILSCIAPFYMLIILRGSLLQSVASISVVLLAARFVSPPPRVGSRKPDVVTSSSRTPLIH